MTTTLRPPSTVGPFQATVVFWPIVAATAAVAAISVAVSPPGWVSVGIVVAVVAGLGIPHGAVDHLVVEALDDRRDTSTRRRFMRDYSLAMAAVALVWLVAPTLALAGFLLLSVHHFGQSDLAYLGLQQRAQWMIQWSRGIVLVGLPLVAHVDQVAPVIDRLGGGDPADWGWLHDRWWLWAMVLIGQHIAVGTVVASGVGDRRVVAREMVTVATLVALFLTADPLIGFAAYFGLWHSVSHLLVLADLLGTDPDPVRTLARLTVPLTAVSLVGLAGVTVAAAIAGRLDLLVPLVFVFVSMLTLPHMVIVERLWRAQDRAERSKPLSGRVTGARR